MLVGLLAHGVQATDIANLLDGLNGSQRNPANFTGDDSVLLQLVNHQQGYSNNNSAFSVYTSNCSTNDNQKVNHKSVDFDNILYEVSIQMIALMEYVEIHLFMMHLMITDVLYLLTALVRSLLILVLYFEKHMFRFEVNLLFIRLKFVTLFLFNLNALLIHACPLNDWLVFAFLSEVRNGLAEVANSP